MFHIPTVKAIVAGCLFLALAPMPLANAAEVSTNIPSSLANDSSAFWKAAMEEFYGPYDQKNKCWIGQSKDGRHCMRPVKMELVTENSRKLRYLVFGGSTLGEDGLPQQCHACVGRVGFVSLAEGYETFSIVAKSDLYETIGGWGDAPAEESFALREIGPNGNLGWTIEGSYSGMGHTFTWFDVYGISAGTFYSLGPIPTGSNDDGNCENGKTHMGDGPCTHYSYEPRFLSQGNASFYPILLDEFGHRLGVPLDATHRIVFDETTFRYDVPEALQEN